MESGEKRVEDVFRITYAKSGDIPTTHIYTYGETSISGMYVTDSNGEPTSYHGKAEIKLESSYYRNQTKSYGAVIHGGNITQINDVDCYATLIGTYRIRGVLNTNYGNDGLSAGAVLVVNNGTGDPTTYFGSTTVPLGTVYFMTES